MCKWKEQLQAPFPPDAIEWRIGRADKKNDKIWATALAYVSNRAIQERLDDVFGVCGWKNFYREWKGQSQLCGISVYDTDMKRWITKWDGADDTNFEGTKGGLSDSMKRAAVQFGIGRYLYKLPEVFVEVSTGKQKGWNYQTKNDKKQLSAFYWKPPELPKWAIPKNINSETLLDANKNTELENKINKLTKENAHNKYNNTTLVAYIDSLISNLETESYRRQRITQLNYQIKKHSIDYRVSTTV